MNKILIVSNMYPSHKYPHYGIFVKNTVDILSNNGYEVTVVAMKKNDQFFAKLISYFFFYIRVIIFGLFFNYSAIYAHYASHTALPLLIVKHLKKTPLVMNVHGNDIVPESKKDEKYIKIVKKILNISDTVISPSKYFKEILINDYNIVSSKIVVFPSGGVDTSKFYSISKEKVLQHLHLSDNEIYIGYVGRIEEKKGWDLFIKATKDILKENSKYRLVIVGSGSQENQFDKLVDELGISKKIYKYDLLSQEELVYIYNVLEVFVFPTYRKSESLGLVGLEAMACETKAVLPDKYGPSSYGKDGVNSFCFKSGDENSLKKAIYTALKYTGKDVKQEARATALQYDQKTTQKILLDLFKKYE